MSHYKELPVQIAFNLKKKCSKKVCEVLVQVSQTLTSFIPCFPSTFKFNSRAHTIKGISHALSVRLLDVHAKSMPYQAATKNHGSIDIYYHTDSQAYTARFSQ